MEPVDERHSKALEVELISDPEEKARQEARNGLRQFDEVIEQINYWLHPERPFRLRISSILHLHRKALEGISHFAGVFRPLGLGAANTRHRHLIWSLNVWNRCVTTLTSIGLLRPHYTLGHTLCGV